MTSSEMLYLAQHLFHNHFMKVINEIIISFWHTLQLSERRGPCPWALAVTNLIVTSWANVNSGIEFL